MDEAAVFGLLIRTCSDFFSQLDVGTWASTRKRETKPMTIQALAVQVAHWWQLRQDASYQATGSVEASFWD